MKTITSVHELLVNVSADTRDWTNNGFVRPWFRGVTDADNHKLLPSILRNGNGVHEFELSTKFRLLAPGFGKTPETDRIDQWLFLMQHHGVPTRLLDWTESPMVAAFFAVENASRKGDVTSDAAIYAIDPLALNEASEIDCIPNTWTEGSTLQTIKFAFGTQDEKVLIDGERVHFFEKPIAIYPSTVHSRMLSQKSCFTLHGSDVRDFQSIFVEHTLMENRKLIQYRIPKENVETFFGELNRAGTGYASLFPDFDGLAKELKASFGIKS